MSQWSLPSSMLVNEQSSDGSNPTTGAIDTTSANMIIVVISRDNSCTSTTSLYDNLGSSWLLVKSQSIIGTGAAVDMFVGYGASLKVGPVHTFNPNVAGCSGGSTGVYSSIIVQGVICSSTPSPDQSISAASASGVTSVQAGLLSPGANNELIFSTACMSIGSGTWSGIDSGFTLLDGLIQQPNAYGLALGYLIQSVASSTNPTWTYAPAGHTAAINASFSYPQVGGGAAAGTGVSFSTSAGASFTRSAGVRFS